MNKDIYILTPTPDVSIENGVKHVSVDLLPDSDIIKRLASDTQDLDKIVEAVTEVSKGIQSIKQIGDQLNQ